MERDPRSAPGTSAPENDDRGGLTRGLAIRDAHIFRDTVEGGPGCDSARVVNSNLVIDIGKDIPVQGGDKTSHWNAGVVLSVAA